MSVFKYKALKDKSKSVTGRIEADTILEARKKIKAMGLLPVLIDEVTGKNKKVSNKSVRVSSLSLREKVDFTSTLEILTSTGIPIIEALLFIEQNSDSTKIRTLVSDFRKKIIGGTTLGETLEKYRDIFGRVYIGLVKAGEDSGELDKTLLRMLELLRKQDGIKAKVIGALIYPTVVVLLAIAAVIVMLVFVFPAFEEMFNNMGKPLPPITKACMNAGAFMKDYWFILIIGLVIFVTFCGWAYRQPKIRKQIDRFALAIPVLCEMLKFSNFSNFIAVLQVSYEAGIPIVDCLALANLTLDNIILKNAIRQAANRVQQGIHLSVALKSVQEVPSMMTFMIATGEQSGRLGDSLYHCVNYIDKKLDSVIDAFMKMIEPALMIGIGIMVGTLGLALYLPLFQSYQI